MRANKSHPGKRRIGVNDLQKMGGVAALIEAATFVVGFALLLPCWLLLITVALT
jgi:hypothetical protein